MFALPSLRVSRSFLTSLRLPVSIKPTRISTKPLHPYRLSAKFFSVGVVVKMSEGPTKTASSEEPKPITETIKEAVDAAASSVGAVIPSAETVKSTAETTQAQIASSIPSAEEIKASAETAKSSVVAAVPGTTEAPPTSSEKPGIHNLTTQEEYDNAVNDKDTLLVIDFYATWCGPCKVIAPQIVKFAKKYPNVRFFNLDVDDLPALSKELNVRAMPTFVLYKGGNKVSVVVGANPKALEAAIKANLEGGVSEAAAPAAVPNGAPSTEKAPNGTTPATATPAAKPIAEPTEPAALATTTTTTS